MLNRVIADPFQINDRYREEMYFEDPNYMENPEFEKEERINYQDRFERTRPPAYLPGGYEENPYLNEPLYFHPPALPVTRTAQYKFVDAATGRLISNVKITRGLTGLGYSVNSTTGTGTFSLSETNKTYTARKSGYKTKSFIPIAGKVTTVYMQKSAPKTAQYKFVDAATGKLISGVKLTPINDVMKNIMLRGLGTPTYANGIYTFPGTDFKEYYNISATGYNPKNVLISEHSGVTTIKLTQQRATVRFLDSLTKKPVTGVTVRSGLTGLLGLGATYSNNKGLFTFSFKSNESRAIYTITAPGYQSQKVTITPTAGIKTIKLKQIVKQPPISITNDDTAWRLRLAKAKAKARIRKIKLLAV